MKLTCLCDRCGKVVGRSGDRHEMEVRTSDGPRVWDFCERCAESLMQQIRQFGGGEALESVGKSL